MACATKKYKFEPDYAVLPGETLKEVMASLSMSQKELALHTGLTAQSVNRILKGDQPFTYETANKIELATDVPAHFCPLKVFYKLIFQLSICKKRLASNPTFWNNAGTK